MKHFFVFVTILFCGLPSMEAKHTRLTAEEYIAKYKDGAIAQMKKYKVPASITLAQALLESGNGNSELAVKAKNHFGIKCHSSWTGPTFIKDDDKKDECFRKYSSVYDSYRDHSKFLANQKRYAPLFELKITDYKGWAKGLKKAGYATNPKYPALLINLIERYELYQYDGKYKAKKKDNTVKQDKQPIKKENKPVVKAKSNKHKILRLGTLKYIIIKKGDTFYSIAKETDKDLWQLYKYNDMKEGDILTPGKKLFLQPKRNKAKVPYHKVKEGETMKSISQHYGIKLKALYKKNNMQPGSEPTLGQQLYLRKYKPTDSY